MNTISRIAVAAAAVAVALAAGQAEARDRGDVQWSVTVGTPAPVIVAAPVGRVYAPVYESRPAYGRRAHPTRWDRDGDGIPNRYDRYDNLHRGR